MKIIVYDFEVFRYDTLLGCIILDGENETVYQTWDLNNIKKFYEENIDNIWIGFNSANYDTLIMEAIVKGQSAYVKSKELIGNKYRPKCKIKLYDYDLLNGYLKPFSLKQTEALAGKSIDTTEVDFDLPRPLTQEEKLQTEKYNLSDLKQTLYNFNKLYGRFELRLKMISEFKIPLQEGLHMTGTQIAAAALGAKANPALEYMPLHPYIFPTLRVKNEELLDWYLNEKFRSENSSDRTLVIRLCNTDIQIAAGGAHSKTKKYHCDKALYGDISGYYNNIQLSCDLLPRTMNDDSKNLYSYMYHSQLKLKKTNPALRAVYKKIVLAVFGAMTNEYTDFYDPWKGPLVTTTGEMYIIDLLEKLDGLGTAFNINTDGFMFEPFNWNDEEKIRSIIDEWTTRIGFPIKTGIITDYYGRDVNCYVMKDVDGSIVTKGDSVKAYDTSDAAYSDASYFDCKDPPIIAKGIVECLMTGCTPEEFIESHKEDLIWYQYICKKNTYSYMTFDTVQPNKTISSVKVQSPTRVFASNDGAQTFLKKHKKGKLGKAQSASVPNLPESIFIWNDEILSDNSKKAIMKKIDYQYYINRIYEKLNEFL